MALSSATWLSDLTDYIGDHIVDTLDVLSEDVAVYIRRELVRPFSKPIITLADFSDTMENSGGMNVVSDTEQGRIHYVDFYVTVNTDDRTGRGKKCDSLYSLLTTETFGKRLHDLVGEIDGLSVTVEGSGAEVGGPTGDHTWWQRSLILRTRVIVSFTSVTI